MSTKKDQHKAGIPQKPRGQEMGRGDDADQNRAAMKNTPALRGRLKEANQMFGDESAQHMGGDAVQPSSASPSLPAAIPTGVRMGESGGEKVFKRRQSRAKAKVKR